MPASAPSGLKEKILGTIKKQDLFGVPVQLKYRGQTQFNSVFGGCISCILLFLAIVGFIWRLYTLLYSPNYQNFPAIYSYERRNVTIEPVTGSTVAVKLTAQTTEDQKKVRDSARVVFDVYHMRERTRSYIPAVDCAEMYSEQIAQEAEANDSPQASYFTENFYSAGEAIWICPNTTGITIGDQLKFEVAVTRCDEAESVDYAEGWTCDPSIELERMQLTVRSVSTNFEPYLYKEKNEVQLFSSDSFSSFDPNGAFAYLKIDLVAQTLHTFYDNFIWPYSYLQVHTTMLEAPEDFKLSSPLTGQGVFARIQVQISSELRTLKQSWYMIYGTDFLSNFASLALAVFKGTAFVVGSFHKFDQAQAMVSTLYGETSASDESRQRAASLETTSDANDAKRKFEQIVRGRKEFSVGYFQYLFYTKMVQLCCCCFLGRRQGVLRRSVDKYRKFQLALQRLSFEQDIQHIIQMNRLTRILHNANFLARQRHAISFSYKYVITDKDLESAEKQKTPKQVDSVAGDVLADRILSEFDPENDEQDRRLLFEVTGLRLIPDEFKNEDSSSEGSLGEESKRDGDQDYRLLQNLVTGINESQFVNSLLDET